MTYPLILQIDLLSVIASQQCRAARQNWRELFQSKDDIEYLSGSRHGNSRHSNRLRFFVAVKLLAIIVITINTCSRNTASSNLVQGTNKRYT